MYIDHIVFIRNSTHTHTYTHMQLHKLKKKQTTYTHFMTVDVSKQNDYTYSFILRSNGKSLKLTPKSSKLRLLMCIIQNVV